MAKPRPELAPAAPQPPLREADLTGLSWIDPIAGRRAPKGVLQLIINKTPSGGSLTSKRARLNIEAIRWYEQRGVDAVGLRISSDGRFVAVVPDAGGMAIKPRRTEMSCPKAFPFGARLILSPMKGAMLVAAIPADWNYGRTNHDDDD